LSPWWWRRYVLPKPQFLQELHSVTSQKTEFFIVTAVKTTNLAKCVRCSVAPNDVLVPDDGNQLTPSSVRSPVKF
jgi:hypothetical protein